MLLRALCFASLILLIIPSLLEPLRSHAQGGNLGEKWLVELTREIIIHHTYNSAAGEMISREKIAVSFKVEGEVEILETDYPDYFLLKGNGTGTLTITDLPGDLCTANYPSGSFQAEIQGYMDVFPSDGNSGKHVTIGAEPTDFSIFGPYTLRCKAEEGGPYGGDIPVTYLGPKGPGGDGLLEELTAGKTFQRDPLPGDPIESDMGTAKISPPGISYYVHGTVKDTAGHLILGSKLVRIEFEKISNELPLKKLSESKPEFEDQTTSDNTNARYEFRYDREAGKFNERLLVVSLLWYDGEGEFAVTNGAETGGRYILVYLAQCVDNVGENCAKWNKTDRGFEAELNFVYGSNVAKTFSVIGLEAWQPGSSGSLDQLMAESALVYSNSYKAMKYFEGIKSSTGAALNPIMIRVRAQGADCVSAEFDGAAKQNKNYPSFGDLGEGLEKVLSTGSSIRICDQRSATTWKDIPVGREWHELSHYLNFEMYFNFDGRPYENHGGYSNESTNDSLAEGFAEFVAMLIAEHYGNASPNLYPTRDKAPVNLEEDYKVWGESVFAERQPENGTLTMITFPVASYHEEWAIAGILWDMHDSGIETNPKHVIGQDVNGQNIWTSTSKIYPDSADKVALSGEQILQAIKKDEPKTLFALHEALKSIVSGEQLDMIFVNHGAFGDVTERNLVQDLTGEQAGPTGHTPNRLVRGSSPPTLPGSYLTTNADANLRVNIVHEEPFSNYDYSYTLDMAANEPAYFEMPPSYYPSRAIIDQVSSDGNTMVSNVTTIGSHEYWNYIRTNPKIDEIFRTLPVSVSSPATDDGDTTTPPKQNFPSQPPSGCLIATAAFGSELTPQVQFLREFRDNYILSTATGSSFMNAFNAWYYSFSPAVADYERGQPWLQQTVRIAIQPLLGILGISEKAYSLIPGEYGSMSAGVVASSFIGATYFWPVALPLAKLKSRWVIGRVVGVLVVGSMGATVLSLVFNSSVGLVISTSTLVLAAAAWSALATSMSVTTLLKWTYNRFCYHCQQKS